MKAAGFTAGTMEQRLAAAVTQARKGKEEVEAFTRAWERIDRANIERTNVSRQLSFLSGGGDARQLYKLDALADAEDMLRKIKTPEALDAIRTKLKALGFEGNTAAEALAKFFASADEGRNTIQIMSRLQEAMRGAAAESASLNAQIAGYRRGAGLGEAVARYDAINRKVEDFRQQLIASGDSAEVAAGKVAEFRDVLIANDRASEALDRVRKRAERTRDMWRESFSDMKK
ncbi:hypothetical protein, partial [Parvimonas sp. M20]|uniref:hypothetical protein n=2 Tax=unclassified Parvimonas TaxID=1151464 RepID=UPI002B4916D3